MSTNNAIVSAISSMRLTSFLGAAAPRGGLIRREPGGERLEARWQPPLRIVARAAFRRTVAESSPPLRTDVTGSYASTR
jgi:hypothetical protein